MMLVEEGKVQLDAPLQNYIPEYTYSSQVTIRQLLNMTSGIPDMINEVIAEEIADSLKHLSKKDAIIYENRELSRPFSLHEVLELVNGRELNFQPGEKIRYSNTNYSFLGSIVERLSGQTLAAFMEEHIFEPLGMKDTSANPEDATCPGYERTDEIIYLGYGRDRSGDGCIVSTTHDLCLWLNAVLKKKLLSQDSW